MASLILTGGEDEFSWQITGLGKPFNQANYRRAGITRFRFTQSAPAIHGVVDDVYPPYSGGNTSTSRKYVDYEPGTYTFYAFAQDKDNGIYWPAGSSTVTVNSAEKPEAGSISGYQSSEDSLEISVNWSVDNWMPGTVSKIQAKQDGGDYWDKVSGLTGSYGSDSFNVNGPGLYYVRLVTIYEGVSTTVTYGPIEVVLKKPSKWNWSWSAQNAFDSRGDITALTRTEYNDFIDRVNEAIAYYNKVNNVEKSLVQNHYRMGQDKILYASSFKKLVEGVNQLYWSGIDLDNIKSGKVIYGSYFTNLSSALNAYLR